MCKRYAYCVSDMRKELTCLDLFCGAGGLALGFKHAGFRTLAGIDLDRQSLDTFSQNFPEAIVMEEDLSQPSVALLKFFKSLKDKVDVVVGGPPCQGFSIAGKRILDDPRNLLYKNYISAVAVIKPRYVLIENVPNIRTLGGGKVERAIVDDLKTLGYTTEVITLNAADFGVPQNRRRAFFLAKLNGRPIGFPNASTVETKVTTLEAISDLPSVDDYFDDAPIEYDKPPASEYQRAIRMGSTKVFNHWSVAHTEKTKYIISLVPDGGNYKDLPNHLQDTRKVNIAWTRMNSKAPSFTIDAGHNHHFHYSANRVPTVRESARLQSFPDSFIFLGNKTSQFRQVGNAVPPLLSKAIAEVIRKDLL